MVYLKPLSWFCGIAMLVPLSLAVKAWASCTHAECLNLTYVVEANGSNNNTCYQYDLTQGLTVFSEYSTGNYAVDADETNMRRTLSSCDIDCPHSSPLGSGLWDAGDTSLTQGEWEELDRLECIVD